MGDSSIASQRPKHVARAGLLISMTERFHVALSNSLYLRTLLLIKQLALEIDLLQKPSPLGRHLA